jgi:hypothetical protein
VLPYCGAPQVAAKEREQQMTSEQAARLIANPNFQQSVAILASDEAQRLLAGLSMNLALWCVRTSQNAQSAVNALLIPLTAHPNVSQHNGEIPNDGDLAFAIREIVPRIVT